MARVLLYQQRFPSTQCRSQFQNLRRKLVKHDERTKMRLGTSPLTESWDTAGLREAKVRLHAHSKEGGWWEPQQQSAHADLVEAEDGISGDFEIFKDSILAMHSHSSYLRYMVILLSYSAIDGAQLAPGRGRPVRRPGQASGSIQSF
ncbi:predicted protein [Plenodomus lingam JN3]|uniref:Predicted protein n=2 Tax=Leptosphaeria maculans TaxID=5022 RepID=E4ZH52_LEPMJ|nr:predicted protein [Plenodomus lingam JN3]CBX90622.1 predicted protein [Plenodomus lingam JN3]